MFHLCRRSLLQSASRPVARAIVPSTSLAPSLLRSFSQLSLTRPALSKLSLPSPNVLTPSGLGVDSSWQQTRTFKMPSCMRKSKSPVARNTGAGKTARKHSARRAKRRRQRAKKIN